MIGVVVNGQHFDSLKSACEAYGVTFSAVYAYSHRYNISYGEAIEHYIGRSMQKVSRIRWTEEEDKVLRDRYCTDGANIEELKHHSTRSIQQRAQKLGLSKLGSDEWTKEEIDILRREYPVKGCNIPELMGRRSKASIMGKARTEHLYMHARWSMEEVEILKKKYKTYGSNIPELVQTRGREAISLKAAQLGLKILPSTAMCVAKNNDVLRATTVRKGWIAVRCQKCGRIYILPELEAKNFEHSKCSILIPMPKGWKLTRQTTMSNKDWRQH